MSTADQKTDVEFTEGKIVSTVDAQYEAEIQEALRAYVPGSDEEKKLLRKIDLHLMPTLWLMYVLNYIDRTNIGNARIAGMEDDLQLDDQRYAWILSIFFFGYLICEVPSNMILSRSKPSWFLPGIMLVWGVLSALMALANTYGAMLGFRFVLGCIESGFFPGVLFVMSCWYKTAELGKRFGIFYTAAVLSGAFGGLLAGGITSNLNGSHGIAGWRWLFIVEGAATVGFSIIAFFVLLDYPSTSKQLTLAQRQLAVVRILHDGIESGAANKEDRLTHWEAFKAACVDPRTYAFMFLFVLDVGAGTISYFIPTITKTLGYTSVTAQYMTVPIYAVATVILNIVAWSSDRTGDRRFHIAASLTLGFVCALICAIVTQPVVRYVMVCFLAAGIWSALPQILAWTSATINLPAEKRAIVIAMVNAVGNLSSVYGSRIWPNSDGPKYSIGFGVTSAFLGLGAVVALCIPLFLKWVKVPLTKAEREKEERKEQRRRAVEDGGAERGDSTF